jgi:DNA-binding MarR family transcriptional regulator
VAESDAFRTAPSPDAVVDAVLGASRALFAIAVRSVAAVDVDLTLTQYRVLVLLSYTGDRRTVDLANELGVNSSTATRMVDRLVRRRLVTRSARPDDRRANQVEITSAGRAIVGAVMEHRRAEVRKLLRKVPIEKRQALVDSLDALCAAAGELPESEWSMGWRSG